MDFQTNGTAEGTILYTYDPNPAAAGIFIAIFGLAGVGHFIGMIWLKTAFFIPLLIGCIMEAFGYYGRLWSSRSPQDFGAFILQSFMLVLAPLFISATVYMSLSRVLNILRPSNDTTNFTTTSNEKKPKPRRSCCFRCCCCCCLSISRRRGQPHAWLSLAFILSDVACFVAQLAGLGMQATTSASVQQTGRSVLVVGLVLQCVVTAAFGALVLRHAVRLGKQGRSGSDGSGSDRNRGDGDGSHDYDDASSSLLGHRQRRYLHALAAAAALLLLRNIVRVAEYAQGAGGYVSAHEAFVYLCDACPVFAVLLLVAVYHPGRLARLARRGAARSGRTGWWRR